MQKTLKITANSFFWGVQYMLSWQFPANNHPTIEINFGTENVPWGPKWTGQPSLNLPHRPWWVGMTTNSEVYNLASIALHTYPRLSPSGKIEVTKMYSCTILLQSLWSTKQSTRSLRLNENHESLSDISTLSVIVLTFCGEYGRSILDQYCCIHVANTCLCMCLHYPNM